MAEPELKLELPCPRCGTSNIPTAQRCRQCYHDFDRAEVGHDDAPVSRGTPGLFDFPRPMVACGSCGRSNSFSASECIGCGAPMPASADEPATPAGSETPAATRLRNAVKARRKMTAGAASPAWLNLAWLARLSSVLYLFWGVIDVSYWLTNMTAGIALDDPSGLRYIAHAIFELCRNACIVGGVWLLTMLRPRR